MSKLLMPYDLYERHHVVATLLRGRGVLTVLDVGGNLGVLKQFLAADILALNVGESADRYYDGRTIPFESDSFDAVVSLDTLEHVPPTDRPQFMREIVRVSRRHVIVSAPYGSAEHRAYEQKLDALYTQTFGTPHNYLNEHVRYGIPDLADLELLTKPLPVQSSQLYFAGNFVWQCRNFERSITQRDRALTRRYLEWTSKAMFHPIHLTRQAYSRANRFYFYAEKSTTHAG